MSRSPSSIRVRIDSEQAIVEARQRGRELAQGAGFSVTDTAMIATAISELARNSLHYAKDGELVVRLARQDGRLALTIVASDRGPGIADIPRALEDGYSTSGGLGIGLPGVKRLMDEFAIASAPGRGTKVTTSKWRT